MQGATRLVSVKKVLSSPYRPMANGDKFNSTLTKTLVCMCCKRKMSRDWDRCLEPLLFAYREAHQRSSGFSPFELLYGLTVRGPMTSIQELRTKEGTDHEVVTTCV